MIYAEDSRPGDRAHGERLARIASGGESLGTRNLELKTPPPWHN